MAGWLSSQYGLFDQLLAPGRPQLGNLQMAPGTTLTLGGGGGAVFTSLMAGKGTTINAPAKIPGVGSVIVNQTLHPTGLLTINGDLEITNGMTYDLDLAPGLTTAALLKETGLIIDNSFILQLAGAGQGVIPSDKILLFQYGADGITVNGVTPTNGSAIQVMLQVSASDPFNSYVWDTLNAQILVDTTNQDVYLTGVYRRVDARAGHDAAPRPRRPRARPPQASSQDGVTRIAL